MTKTVSIKLSEDDFQALVKYCGHEDLDKSKLVREALRKCVPKFKGMANPEGFPKGRKHNYSCTAFSLKGRALIFET